MTVIEFSEMCHSDTIKIISAYNGKVLCRRFDKYNKKHMEDISKRQVSSSWPEIHVVGKDGFSPCAVAAMCVYVVGDKEYEEDLARHKLLNS